MSYFLMFVSVGSIEKKGYKMVTEKEGVLS